MSMITIRTGVVKSRKGKHQVMAHTGFGECKTLRNGEVKLGPERLAVMTIAEAMKLNKKTELGYVVA